MRGQGPRKDKVRPEHGKMLLNTHTLLLKEYAGSRLGRDNLDILIYNVMPDILPISRASASPFRKAYPPDSFSERSWPRCVMRP